MSRVRGAAAVPLLLALMCTEARAQSGSGELCVGATTLIELMRCIRGHMAPVASMGYRPPDRAARRSFGHVVGRMMSGSCDFALPANLAHYRLRVLTDQRDGRAYCVLLETVDADADGVVDRGWGTFIVNPRARRPGVHHAAPHPRTDRDTEIEAVELFRLTSSGSFLMCGARRNSNPGPGACQRKYGPADCAHQRDSAFQAAVEALDRWHRKRQRAWVHLQWHSNRSCVPLDVYGSLGGHDRPPAGSALMRLRQRMSENQPQLSFQVTDSGSSCALDGTENVQGRYLHGSPDPCTATARASDDRFVHLEQSRRATSATIWARSIAETWPAQRTFAPSRK